MRLKTAPCPCIAVDGRHVDQSDSGAIRTAFERWQLWLELLDPGDEA
jgi:hypothetical protein